MSDDTPQPEMPFAVAAALEPNLLRSLNRSCELALAKQLNINEQNPVLKALADKWKTMDAFSKRELGGHDVKPPETIPTQTMPVTAQLAPGQHATVTGPSTIYGGEIKIEETDAKQEQSTS